MIIWVDAQLSPALAEWLRQHFPVEAAALREVGLRDATDPEIFHAARGIGAVVMTKDADFVALVDRLGPPPAIIWITCGNTSNARLRQLLSVTLADALTLIERGESLVEIRDI
jgi:predicted nuclease of predicted toxin-antitoxin system